MVSDTNITLRNASGILIWFLGMSLVWWPASIGMSYQKTVDVSFANDSESPVQISDANGRLSEHVVEFAQETETKRGFRVMPPSKPRQSRTLSWKGWAGYRNRTQQPITAVKFRWEFLDAFDEPKWAFERTLDIPMLPGQSVEHAWREEYLPDLDITKVSISIEAVRFTDQNMWQRSARGQGIGPRMSEVSEVTRLERQRLLDIYQREGTDALLGAIQQ